MYNTKGKTQKSYKKNKPNLNLVPKNCVVVFPIELVGGKTQVSNQGIMPGRKYYDKGSFLYWQEVFDGRSALKIQWEDSILLEKPEGKNYYLAKPSIGTYYYGKPISNGSEQLEISEDASYEDFISMKASQTVTLRFEYDPTDRESSKWEIQKLFRFILVDNDIYNLYLIPELCEEKLMYIQDHQEYYDDLTGLSKGCEITFASLGDKIQKSGKAIEQYCSWNAPGEFAVKPMVLEYYDFDTEQWEKQVTISPREYYTPEPIQYLQVEQQGPALTSTIYALGRRQEWVEVEDPETGETTGYWKIGPSKLLFPYKFIVTQPNPLNRTSTPTKNFFCFPEEQVTMITTDDCLQWIFDHASQPLEQVKNGGMISIGKNWTEGGDNNSNPLPTGEGVVQIRKDYYDNTWHPLGYSGAFVGPYDTKGCIYATDTISYDTNDTMIDIMCKNAFIYNQQPIIPLSFYSTRPLYLRNIPLIGTIANFFHLGDIKLANHTTSRQCSNLCFFGDADIMLMCASLQGKMGTPFGANHKVFPINFFGTNENQYQKLGVNSVNTTFCFSLTDQVSIDNTVWDTIYLGQSTREDGTELFPETHQSLLANSTIKPVSPVTSNFIIDAVIVQSIFDGKIKISCFTQDEGEFIYPEWTATILSNANWENGNMRDWTNMFLLSNWEERFCRQEDQFVWPLGPHKKESEDYTLDLNAQTSFAFLWNEGTLQHSNSWQDVLNDWPKSLKAPHFGNWAWQSVLNRTLVNRTITYSDMGIAAVTDRASFLEYFGGFAIDFGGTYIKLEAKQVTPDQPTKTWLFEEGKYTYQSTVVFCSIRESGKNLPVEDLQFQLCEVSHHIDTYFKGHFYQRLVITLTLNENNFLINIVDKSGCYIDDTPETRYIKGDCNFCDRRKNPQTTGPRYYKEQFESSLQCQKLTLHKRT